MEQVALALFEQAAKHNSARWLQQFLSHRERLHPHFPDIEQKKITQLKKYPFQNQL